MKIKKEHIEKLILGILTFILIIYIGFGLIIFSLFNISEKFLNKDNVYEFVSNIDVINIIKNELGNEIYELDLIEDELKEIGLTEDKIDKLIDSEDTKKLSSNIVTNMFNKIARDSSIEYRVTTEQINELIESNIDKVSSNIDKDSLLNTIEKKVPNLVLNINGLLDKFYNKLITSETVHKYQDYMYKSMNILDLVYSDFVLGLIIFIIISFMALLIFIRKNIYKSLKWLSIAFIIPTVLFGIISTFIFSFVNTNNILINGVFDIINNDLIKYSVIYFIISIVFVIINIVIYAIRKYKKRV